MPGQVATDRQVLDRLLDDGLHRELLTIALAIIGDPTVAEDVVHDLYVAVLDGRSNLANASDPRAYLRAWARNEARRRAGQLVRRKSRNTELDEGRAADTRPSVRDCYFVQREIPARLPQHLRPVYRRWCRGMTQEEMAANLACSRSTVQRRWADLRTRLKESLGFPEKL